MKKLLEKYPIPKTPKESDSTFNMQIMADPSQRQILSKEEWEKQLATLIQKEKDLSKHVDEVNQLRQKLPWMKIEKDYIFEGPNGVKLHLRDLFGEKSDLLVYHLMFAATWEEPCKSCTAWVDHFNALFPYLSKASSIAVIAAAPFVKLDEVKKKRNWPAPIYSTGNSDFNSDFNVANAKYRIKGKEQTGEQLPGASAFHKASDGTIYCTYHTSRRGVEKLNSFFSWVDMLPNGRAENFPVADL